MLTMSVISASGPPAFFRMAVMARASVEASTAENSAQCCQRLREWQWAQSSQTNQLHDVLRGFIEVELWQPREASPILVPSSWEREQTHP